MANNYTATPATKPPQSGKPAGKPAPTGGPKPPQHDPGNIKGYMEMRGAKPVSSLGVTQGAGGAAKQRRMTTQPTPPQNIMGRLQSRFQSQNRVPTGGPTQVGNPNARAAMAAALRARGQTPNPGMVPRHHPGDFAGRLRPFGPQTGANGTMARVQNYMAQQQKKPMPNVKNPNATPYASAQRAMGQAVAPTKPIAKGPAPTPAPAITPAPATPRPMAAAGGSTGQMRRNPAVV